MSPYRQSLTPNMFRRHMDSEHKQKVKLPEAEITIQTPEHTWIHEVSKDNPDVVFTVSSAVADQDKGTAIVKFDANNNEEIVDSIQGHDTVSDAEVIAETSDQVLVQIDTPDPIILHKAQDAGVPIEMPFEIRDGRGSWRLLASRDRLSELSRSFGAMNMEHSVDYVGDLEDEDDDEMLTERQRYLVDVALKVGYYDTPRTATLDDVAEEVELAKSTCSEILHRAEGKVLESFVESS